MPHRFKDKRKQERLSFNDLIDNKEWQKIQDNFSVITGVGLRTVDMNGKLITAPSKWPRLCSNMIKKAPLKEKLCGPCLPTFLGGNGIVDKNLSYICNDGFYNFITPIKGSENDILAYFLVGPVFLVTRKSKSEYSNLAQELGVDLEDLWSAILEIKVVSFQGIQALIELIKDIGEYTIKLAYQNVTTRKEMVMAPDASRLERLLHTLLDVAFQVTSADIGSIMAFDNSGDYLTIHASRGISEEIVKNTKIKIGEGISGMALEEKTPFIINDQVSDERIKQYLNRPYLSSSMVLPVSLDDSLKGVINLGTLKTSTVRFNEQSVKLINRLVDLAALAITPIK